MKKYIVALSLLLILFPCLSDGFIIKPTVSVNQSYWRPLWQGQGTMVQGTWLWVADALQTDSTSVKGELPGIFYNSTNANLDEYKWSNIYLTKGTYKITIIASKHDEGGLAELLFGTSLLGTKDLYNLTVQLYNQLWETTFTLTSDTTADLRLRVNGSSATGHLILFSRFVIEKVG